LLNCYVQQYKRRVLWNEDVSKADAINFLMTVKYAVVYEDESIITLEELQNVKTVGSVSRDDSDNSAPSGGEVSEDPYRELFEPIGGNTE